MPSNTHPAAVLAATGLAADAYASAGAVCLRTLRDAARASGPAIVPAMRVRALHAGYDGVSLTELPFRLGLTRRSIKRGNEIYPAVFSIENDNARVTGSRDGIKGG